MVRSLIISKFFWGFRRGKKLTNEVLRDHIFVEEERNIYVWVSVFECYLLHATITENLTGILGLDAAMPREIISPSIFLSHVIRFYCLELSMTPRFAVL